MEVSAKNLWLQILLNRWRDSCMRFCEVRNEQGELLADKSRFKYFVIAQLGLHLPLRRPLRAPCRMHWELRKKWCRSHPRNNGSTSFSLTSGRPRQTSCSPHKVRTDSVRQCLPGCHSAVRLVLVSDFCSASSCDSPEVQLFAGELFFNDTGGFDSRSQHILLSGEVVWVADSVHFIEVAEDGR